MIPAASQLFIYYYGLFYELQAVQVDKHTKCNFFYLDSCFF